MISSVVKETEGQDLNVMIELPADKFQVGEYVTVDLKKEMGEFNICVPIESLHQGEKANIMFTS